MLNELCEGSETQEPGYQGDSDRFLEDLYNGLNPDTSEAKLERCCRFLGVRAPSCESHVELEGFYRVMEHEAVKRHMEECRQHSL